MSIELDSPKLVYKSAIVLEVIMVVVQSLTTFSSKLEELCQFEPVLGLTKAIEPEAVTR
jgi:hypothetical protein